MRLRIIGLVVLGLLLLGLAHAATVQEAQDKLKTFRQNIQYGRKSLEQMQQQMLKENQLLAARQKQEHSILKDLERIERKTEIAEERYSEHQENLRVVRVGVANLRYEIIGLEQEINRKRQQLALRLRALYKEQQIGLWPLVASSRSLAEVWLRLRFFHALASQNAFLVGEFRNRLKISLQKHQQLSAREEQSQELEIASKQSLDTILENRQTRQGILEKVRQDKAEHEQAVRELAQAAQRLNQLLGDLEQKARRMEKQVARLGMNFSKQQRSLPWPTRGRVVTRFGKVRHPRFDTYMYNKGIDIAGSIGQNVNSVARGQVLFAEWFEGYGRMVILDHGGGFNTVYAHLQKIMVSEETTVEAGQTIGTLGDSGNWKGPVLYFEIRKRGAALDPADWLE